MSKVYLDEQIGNFVSALEESGHDVLFAGDGGRSGRSDAWHFREAMEDGRVMITFNRRDFDYLHRLWTTLGTLRHVQSVHHGILTCAPDKGVTPIDWLPAVVERLKAEVPRGHMLHWIPRNQIWRLDAVRPEEG